MLVRRLCFLMRGEAPRTVWLAAVLLVGLVLAGCTGDTIGPAAGDDAPAAGGATLRGTVLTEELAPIAGALVAVEEAGANATTATDGTFEVSSLDAGTYRVVAQAIGFIGQAQTISVGADETTNVQFRLERAPVQEPYKEVLIFEGYEVCTLVLGVTVQQPPCTETPETEFVHKMEDSWRYLVTEMDWETSDSMWLIMTPEGGACNTGADNWCWNQLGTAPLRIEGGPDDVKHAKQYALDGESVLPNGSFPLELDTTYGGMFRDEVNGTLGDECNLIISTVIGQLGQQWNPNLGCGLGYGYSTGVRFTYYLSVFHWAPPDSPATYTALPDE